MTQTTLTTAKILIVDDEKANVLLLEMILEDAGYKNVHSTTDARQALPIFLKIRPDLVLLDLSMPHLNGFAVMEQLLPQMREDTVPIIVLTADSTLRVKHKSLQQGARDFLTKPLDEIEVLLRINNLLESRFHNVLLETKVEQRTHELEKAQLETLQRLALASEYRDDDTGMHTRRVGLTAGCIADALGLPAAQVDLIMRAAPLHDVGKIGITDAILLKPDKLTADEFDTMKQHTIIGGKILSGSSSPWLKLAEQIALTHHERWDGKGYPFQHANEEIALVGRIVAVADVFDALTHERPYKKAWPLAEARAEIMRQSGTQFDPQVVQAFLSTPHEAQTLA